MDREKNQIGSSTKRLKIDRRMVGILSVFAVLGICLLFTINIATNTLSGLRGFSSLQTHWTELRKEATLQLSNYLNTKNRRHFARFDSALALIDSARKIRTELSASHSDHGSIRSNFVTLHALPRDIGNMVTAYERFQDFADFRKAIRQWAYSDSLVKQMEKIALQSHTQIEKGTFSVENQKDALEKVSNLDARLTKRQYTLTEALSAGTAYLNDIVLFISISLGVILLVTGGFLSFRFLKSLKKWRRAIEVREQEYRSLFEVNPNAVFSLSTAGEFLKGNRALEKLSGYSIDELRGQNIAELVEPSELDKVKGYYQEAAAGNPRTYETTWTKKDGESIFLEITNLPIYVDNEITGIYGIAQNITDRKQKEKKIKDQLKEKTHLLSEVHDRVKNNLALVSGLIKLQHEDIREEGEKSYFDNIVSRIHSMAMVHEQLYQTENFSNLRIDKYIRDFSRNIDNLVSMGDPKSRIVLDIDPVTLSIKQAIPVALLLNELITNAYKYGSSNDGNITVSLQKQGQQITFQVKDYGPGLPEDHGIEQPKSLGLRLVKVLISQLNAKYTLNRNGGTTVTISFESLNGSLSPENSKAS